MSKGLKKFGLKRAIKRNLALHKERSIQGFSATKRIAVLSDDLVKHKSAIEQLKKKCDSHQITLLLIAYNNSKEIIKGYPVDFEIGEKDFDFWGNEKEESLKKISETSYDYLFCLNSSPILPFESILAKSKAKCRVGHSGSLSFMDNRLLDLALNPIKSNDANGLVQEFWNTITMLKRK